MAEREKAWNIALGAISIPHAQSPFFTDIANVVLGLVMERAFSIHRQRSQAGMQMRIAAAGGNL